MDRNWILLLGFVEAAVVITIIYVWTQSSQYSAQKLRCVSWVVIIACLIVLEAKYSPDSERVKWFHYITLIILWFLNLVQLVIWLSGKRKAPWTMIPLPVQFIFFGLNLAQEIYILIRSWMELDPIKIITKKNLDDKEKEANILQQKISGQPPTQTNVQDFRSTHNPQRFQVNLPQNLDPLKPVGSSPTTGAVVQHPSPTNYYIPQLLQQQSRDSFPEIIFSEEEEESREEIDISQLIKPVRKPSITGLKIENFRRASQVAGFGSMSDFLTKKALMNDEEDEEYIPAVQLLDKTKTPESYKIYVQIWSKQNDDPDVDAAGVAKMVLSPKDFPKMATVQEIWNRVANAVEDPKLDIHTLNLETAWATMDVYTPIPVNLTQPDTAALLDLEKDKDEQKQQININKIQRMLGKNVKLTNMDCRLDRIFTEGTKKKSFKPVPEEEQPNEYRFVQKDTNHGIIRIFAELDVRYSRYDVFVNLVELSENEEDDPRIRNFEFTDEWKMKSKLTKPDILKHIALFLETVHDEDINLSDAFIVTQFDTLGVTIDTDWDLRDKETLLDIWENKSLREAYEPFGTFPTGIYLKVVVPATPMTPDQPVITAVPSTV